jgi:diguanylate cyclase (GGDEF)-like protein/PAS domain S-box-containing protein
MPTNRIRILIQLAASTLTLWLSFVALGTQGHFLYIWPLTAVQLSIALTDWGSRSSRIAQLAAAFVGELLATVLLGMPLWIGLWLAAVQVLEVSCVAAILVPRVTVFDDLKRRENVLRFGLAALLTPMAAVALVVEPISALAHASFLVVWSIVVPSDTLGIAIVLPALMFFYSGEYRSLRKLRPHLRTGIPALFVFVSVTAFVFLQNSFPFLFLIYPPLVIVLLVLGLEGAASSTIAVAILGIWATAKGHGPMWLIRGATPELRIVILQVFLGTVVAVAMPVGALLDERRRAERSAHEGQSIYQILIGNAEDMIVLSSLDGSRRFVSPAVLQLTGWSDEEYLGLGQMGGMHPEDRDHARTVIESLASGKVQHAFRHRILGKDGRYRWVESFLRGYTDSDSGQVAGYVATVRDISAQIQVEQAWSAERAALSTQNQELSDLALRDELTGIANRRSFNATLDYEFARHTRSGSPLSLLIIDVDFFKKYNDTYGHPAGDRCLRLLAQTLEARVRRITDRVARVGGEEFAAILAETDEAGARKVAKLLLDAVWALAIEHDASPQGRVSISIGVASLSPHHGGQSSALVQEADRALYESKRAGRNRISASGVGVAE